MNYYEHHLGDYLRDAAHLSMLEDGAYRRLLDAYYIREAPLPLDPREVYRLVRAHSKQDRNAVDTVLHEFFTQTPQGWTHSRCEREIAAYREKQPEREAKKANEANRLKRHREERAALFKRITQAGFHAPWNTSIDELRNMVKRLDGNAPATHEQPLAATAPATETATAPATPATATQTPNTKHQTPDTRRDKHTHTVNTHTADSAGVGLRGVGGGGPPNATQAGPVCKAMKAVGIADVNPGHPELLALLEAGATQAEFVGAAEEAARRHKGFAYALGMVKRQRQDAAKVRQSVHHGPLPASDDPRARQLETAALMTGIAKHSAPITLETIDVEARAIPA